MSDAMTRALSASIAPRAAGRAAGPSARARRVARKELPVTEDRTLNLPAIATDVPHVSAEAVAAHESARSAVAASAPQQAVLESAISAENGYTKTRLGTIVLVGNVGASKNILYKRVAGKDLVEFSFAARTFGADQPTWYRVTVWDGAEATLELIRQGTYLQVKGQAVQSQSHRTGKVFLDVTASRVAEGPAKGEALSVAGAQPQRGYFRRLLSALLGR
jgi:Single-strand binding protein family